jgi:phosphoenolpyruvate carboxykinase (GTP)
VLERIAGGGESVETPIGNVPALGSIDTEGIDIDDDTMNALLDVDADAWRAEIPLIEKHFQFVGERLPDELKDELKNLEKRFTD